MQEKLKEGEKVNHARDERQTRREILTQTAQFSALPPPVALT